MEIIELIFLAGNSQQKLPILQKAIVKFDALKFFLQIAWDVSALTNQRYLALPEPLNEVGRMLGGWLRKEATKTSA